MPQDFAFTTAAMAAALEETGVSYEDLAEIEREFDDVETEIIKQQIQLTLPLYKKRTSMLSKIPGFWSLVFEQAPPDVDQYIQPSDSALLLQSLTSLSVDHFELDVSPKSFRIEFEFAANDVFEDSKLVKTFWYRRAKDGWSGFVSEPVEIRWKKGRDLTGGLLDLVVKADRSIASKSEPKSKELTPEQKALKRKIDNTGMGGLSFFAWFGYIGRRISAEESREVVQKENARRKKAKLGQVVTPEEEDDEDEDVASELELEIFPDGDELGIAISDDLWPSAVKYFTQAQEQDAISDADFESDGNDGDEPADNSESGGDEDERPKKKIRSV